MDTLGLVYLLGMVITGVTVLQGGLRVTDDRIGSFCLAMVSAMLWPLFLLTAIIRLDK